MSPILIDTNAYGLVRRGDERAIAVIRNAQSIGLSTIVIGELLAGFACGSQYRRNIAELYEFIASPAVEILPVDHDTAVSYSEIYAQLRVAGKPIPTNDLWLAATAKQHGLAVFTYDKHFALIPDIHSGSSVEEIG